VDSALLNDIAGTGRALFDSMRLPSQPDPVAQDCRQVTAVSPEIITVRRRIDDRQFQAAAESVAEKPGDADGALVRGPWFVPECAELLGPGSRPCLYKQAGVVRARELAEPIGELLGLARGLRTQAAEGGTLRLVRPTVPSPLMEKG